MNAGFIGAGKAGSALGRYFTERGFSVVGYFDTDLSAARRATSSTNSSSFTSPIQLVEACDIVFITVPDGAIATVWKKLCEEAPEDALAGKVICHCSGCMTSAVFDGATAMGALPCTAHPLLAFSDPMCALDDLANAHITLEGNETAVQTVGTLFKQLGNPIHHINAADKPRYHAAAVFASNLVLAPLNTAAKLMESCSFDEVAARDALRPLIVGNVQSFCNKGAAAALTGPVERNDLATVEGHLSVLDAEDTRLYCALTQTLVEIAKDKHPDRDYSAWDSLIGKVQS